MALQQLGRRIRCIRGIADFKPVDRFFCPSARLQVIKRGLSFFCMDKQMMVKSFQQGMRFRHRLRLVRLTIIAPANIQLIDGQIDACLGRKPFGRFHKRNALDVH